MGEFDMISCTLSTMTPTSGVVTMSRVLPVQDGAAPGPGAPVAPAGAGGAVTGEAGTPLPGTGAGGSGIDPIMPMIIVLFLVMIGFMMLGSRRDKKRRETMMSSIRKHDTVQTAGGVIGAVVEVKPDTIILKVDESSNTRITFSKSAVQQILASRDRPSDKETTDAAA